MLGDRVRGGGTRAAESRGARAEWSKRHEGREVMGREDREVMVHEGLGHVTACAGSTGTPAIGEAAAPRGVDRAQRSVVTRQGCECAAAGACGPRVMGAG